MLTEKQVKTLEQALATITKYSPDALISRPEWGTITFEAARADIEHIISMATDLSNLPLRFLTSAEEQLITGRIPNIAEILQNIDTFSIDAGDPNVARDSFYSNLSAYAEIFHNEAGSVIPYLAYKQGSMTENAAILTQTINTTKQKAEDFQKWSDAKQSDIKKTAEAAREAAGSAGVVTFTQEFDKESETLNKRSVKWLRAAGVIAASTISAAVVFYFWPKLPDGTNNWEVLRSSISKMTIIAVLFTGAVWCGRIYRALIHQATVNRHRALSLRTFQAFVKATDDPRVQDAVLMSATKTIFGNVPTGLIDEKMTNQESGVQFVEIGKSAVQKTGKGSDE